MEWKVGRSPADLLSCPFLIPAHATQKRWEPTFLQHCIESNSLGLLGYTNLLGCSQQWRHPSSEWRNHWEQRAVKLQLLPATCLSLNNAWICQKHSLEAATQYLPACQEAHFTSTTSGTGRTKPLQHSAVPWPSPGDRAALTSGLKRHFFHLL